MEKNTAVPSDHELLLRSIVATDYDDIEHLTDLAYGDFDSPWSKRHISRLLSLFPEGQICIEDNGRVIAFALSIIVNSSLVESQHTYRSILGNYTFSTHNPQGDILYGIEVCVHPEYRGMKLGRRLYDARKEICEQLNLRSIVAGGRMPEYHKHKDKMTPKEYIEKVSSKEIFDPVLGFQLSNGFQVKRVLQNYLPMDTDSSAFATLIEWSNIYYEKKSSKISFKKSVVRISVVQWQMRTTESLEAFFDNMEFFVDTASRYKADFLLFPELFNVPLMAGFGEDNTAKAVRRLAEYTEVIRQKTSEFALQYNVNIIPGSMPLYDDGTLYNVAYLCRRNGTWDAQYKIHITPSEVNDWGMKGGDQVQVFETDVAKIGILICYDAEFPELSRKLADEGVQIIFVPFSTDTQVGFQRVRACSMARAIENECYVAIAGSVGNLPKVWSMDLQYAQSAVFSPSDFSFPQNGTVTEATPNAEMALVADVDLDLLKELHIFGSVTNLKDRRKDLYEVVWKGEK